MTRSARTAWMFALLVAALPFSVAAHAEEAAAVPDAAAPVADKPVCASDAVAAAAIEAFKDSFKARGLRGDEKVAQRAWAIEQLGAVQHKDVADTLLKAMNDRDENIRIAAVVMLGEQRALPAYVGKRILPALKRNKKSQAFLISALESIGNLKYLGAGEHIAALIRHQDFSIKKAAIRAVGETGDMRLIDEMLKEIGIDAGEAAAGTGGGEPVDEGYSWEGAEASVDTGTAGDGDQKAAEAAATEAAEKNKSEAEAKNGGGGGSGLGGGGGGGGISGGGGGKGGGGGRSKQELIHPIKAALGKITGEDFASATSVVEWLGENGSLVKQRVGELAKEERAQRKAAP